MNLLAMMVVRNEMDRYLPLVIDSLLEFCDGVRVIDDRSDDGTGEWLVAKQQQKRGVRMMVNEWQPMFEHEGSLRQRLLDYTLAGEPTHIIAVDADEFVPDGLAVRQAVEEDERGLAWSLEMGEVWKVSEEGLSIRTDGGWWPHNCPVIFRPLPQDRNFRISPKQLACGREPLAIRHIFVRGHAPQVGQILHFGWACEADRRRRYERYVVADGGRFHANRHLESIMWSDGQVQLQQCLWPESLAGISAGVLARANRVAT